MIAATDMTLADFIERLSDLTLFEIRAEWRRLHRMPPPMRLSRDLLIRAIAYKKQERAHGGLSKATLRRVPEAVDGSSAGVATSGHGTFRTSNG